MKYRPGEIVLLPFPFSDHSARKKRPVLVLSQPDARGDFASLAITSKETHEKAFALIQEHLSDGNLPKPSWIRFDKVYTLNTSLIVGGFGFLRPAIFKTVHGLFCDHFLCNET
jgi:mRNA interferase MazF